MKISRVLLLSMVVAASAGQGCAFAAPAAPDRLVFTTGALTRGRTPVPQVTCAGPDCAACPTGPQLACSRTGPGHPWLCASDSECSCSLQQIRVHCEVGAGSLDPASCALSYRAQHAFEPLAAIAAALGSRPSVAPAAPGAFTPAPEDYGRAEFFPERAEYYRRLSIACLLLAVVLQMRPMFVACEEVCQAVESRELGR